MSLHQEVSRRARLLNGESRRLTFAGGDELRWYAHMPHADGYRRLGDIGLLAVARQFRSLDVAWALGVQLQTTDRLL